MKIGIWGLFGALVFAGLTATRAHAVTATSFSSFEGEEEPSDRVSSDGGVTPGDTYDNMTSPSSGVFRFYLRYSAGVWDGDRDTGSTDRQRAEVKGLGARQKTNETFEYAHTWKTNRQGSGAFWHVFQLKATNGENASPLVVDSIKPNNTAVVQYCPGVQSGFTLARSYTIAMNTFTTTNIRIKPATSATGVLQASVNGDAMSGATNVELYRPSATEYRPKWGSYRGVNGSSPYGNDTVEQKSITATKK